MTAFWDRKESAPSRHRDPDGAMAEYMEQLRRAEVAGATPPASALNGLGDAYLDKGDIVTAVDYYRQAAEVYAEEEMHDNAIACCKKIRRYRPDDAAVGLMLGRYYAAKGLKADARDELDAFAERARPAGDLERATEALEEILRIDSKAHQHCETLAEAYEESDRAGDAIEAYRTALRGYESEGNTEAVERVRQRLWDLSAEEPEEEVAAEPELVESSPGEPPVEAPVEPDVPEPTPEPVAEVEPEAASEESEELEPQGSDVDPPVDLGLEIERTSYVEEEPVEPDDGEVEPLTVAQEGPEGPVETLEDREPGGIHEVAPDPEESSQEESSPDTEEPSTYAEMFATAGRLAREGDDESAARWLERAAAGLRGDGRWPEAVASYRQLAQLGWVEADHYEAWTECARQTGEPAKVLEALESRARWHLEKGERQEARKAAEEMLLVDPDSRVASELLDQVGATSD